MPHDPIAPELNFRRAKLLPISEERREALIQLAMRTGESRETAVANVAAATATAQAAVTWLSSRYQALITTTSDAMHVSIKRLDKEVVIERSDLVAIGERFIRDRRLTPCELYPDETRVVDTANQYHIWGLKIRRHEAAAAADRALLRPNEEIALGQTSVCIHLPLGRTRDWRDVQALKNDRYGPSREAVDLLVPQSADRGPVLLLPSKGVSVPFGWQVGLRDDRDTPAAGHRQRPFETAAK